MSLHWQYNFNLEILFQITTKYLYKVYISSSVNLNKIFSFSFYCKTRIWQNVKLILHLKLQKSKMLISEFESSGFYIEIQIHLTKGEIVQL